MAGFPSCTCTAAISCCVLESVAVVLPTSSSWVQSLGTLHRCHSYLRPHQFAHCSKQTSKVDLIEKKWEFISATVWVTLVQVFPRPLRPSCSSCWHANTASSIQCQTGRCRRGARTAHIDVFETQPPSSLESVSRRSSIIEWRAGVERHSCACTSMSPVKVLMWADMFPTVISQSNLKIALDAVSSKKTLSLKVENPSWELTGVVSIRRGVLATDVQASVTVIVSVVVSVSASARVREGVNIRIRFCASVNATAQVSVCADRWVIKPARVKRASVKSANVKKVQSWTVQM